MKTDLATSIVVFIVGTVMAYFAVNLLMPESDSVSIDTVNGDTNYSLVTPNEDIFNYRAINPTIEVYVGQCESYDANGNCITNNAQAPDINQEDVPKDDQNGTSKDEQENNPESPEETPEDNGINESPESPESPNTPSETPESSTKASQSKESDDGSAN